MPDTHAFIGVLTQALYEHDVPICLSTLGKILDNKVVVPYRDGFDVGSIVAAAYAYWARRDLRTAHAIASAFRSEDGKPVIAANERTSAIHESQKV